jgi:hypothetical protein
MEEMMAAARGRSGGRRRRSKQPQLEARKRRRNVVVMLIALLALFVVGAFSLFIWFRQRMASEAFRETVNQQLSLLTGVEVSCERFVPSGLADTQCSDIDFRSKEGWFKSASLRKLDAMLSASNLWSKEWNVNSLTIESADLQLVPEQKSLGAKPLPFAKPDAVSGFGVTANPERVTINGFTINKLNVRLPEGRGGDYSLQGMNASGSYVQGVLRLNCSGGVLQGNSIVGQMPISSISLVCKGNSIKIEAAVLSVTKDSNLRIAGEIDLTELGPTVELAYKVYPGFLLRDVVSASWNTRIHTKAYIEEGKYTWKHGEPETISGTLNLDGTVVEGFPANKALTDFCGSELYKRLEFRQFTSEFKKFPDRLVLEKLNGNREGQNRVKGSVTVWEDGKIEGDLELSLGFVNPPVGFVEKDNLYVIPVKISGSAEKFEDSLGDTLQNAKTRATAAPIPGLVPASPQ